MICETVITVLKASSDSEKYERMGTNAAVSIAKATVRQKGEVRIIESVEDAISKMGRC